VGRWRVADIASAVRHPNRLLQQWVCLSLAERRLILERKQESQQQIFATGYGLQEVMEARKLINEAMEFGGCGIDRIAKELSRVARRDRRLSHIDIRCCCFR
jgi:hypothetical protein